MAECIELGNFDQSQYVLAVREGSYQEMLDWLSSGSADFSISIKENLISGFHYDVIGEEPYVMVSSKSVPSDLTIKELKNYPFIIPLSGCKEVLEPYLTKNEIVVNKVMESETISSALALALQVNGITIVPLSGLHKQIIHDFIVQPIEIKIPRQLIMQWSSKKENDPLFLSFITNLLVQLQKKKN